MDRLEFEWLPGVPLPLLRNESRCCPYLPGRIASELCALPQAVKPALYEDLMNRGFRRAGSIFYKPDCWPCRECVPIRVPVQQFLPSRSQRRVLRRNADVTVTPAPTSSDREHYELYCRYQRLRHEDAPGRPVDFKRFLCDSPIETIELDFRAAGRLLGVSVVDVCPNSLSSVYFYYEPDEAWRSLGVFSGLCEIQHCRQTGKPYWYLGFHVAGCAKMEYKSRFQPYELLDAQGQWRAGPQKQAG